MNIKSVQATALLGATITPADPLSSDSYRIGFSSQPHALAEKVNQLYSIKITNLTAAATLGLDSGTLTGGGSPNVGGGGGKDPDGEEVDLNFVHALQIRNTSPDEALIVETTQWTEGAAPFDMLNIPANGEALFVLPDGESLAEASMVFTPEVSGSFEFLVLGKK